MSMAEVGAIDHSHSDATDIFGFWLYILTDCILFGCLFASYLVLSSPSAFGPHLKAYVHLPDVLTETLVLLFSNLSFGLAAISLYSGKMLRVKFWLLVTFLLGLAFLNLELQEFVHLAAMGFRWDYHAQASAFFTLVGTHGLHVTCGLIWILVLFCALPRDKPRQADLRRMVYLGLFWNFLDIVWIFVFTIVYLVGALS